MKLTHLFGARRFQHLDARRTEGLVQQGPSAIMRPSLLRRASGKLRRIAGALASHYRVGRTSLALITDRGQDATVKLGDLPPG